MQEYSSLVGYLTTTGRVTGNPHTVALRLVCYQGRIYASRRDARSDWCRNALRNPAVAVEVAGQHLNGVASLVTDRTLRQKISELKYGDLRNFKPRTVIEITPGGAQ